jgi:galactokinase
MLDIGPIHRREYELVVGRSAGVGGRSGRVLTGDSKSGVKTAKAGKPSSGAGRGASGTKKIGVSKGIGASKGSGVSKGVIAKPKPEPVVIAQAPGRIHLLGEHGDPVAGLYLSVVIDRWIKVAVSARRDNSLRFYAADLGERKRTTLANLRYKREDRWANYIKTAISLFAELGIPFKGMNFTLTGDIPPHIGLASSSAIEVASAVALRNFLHVRMSDKELIKRLAESHLSFLGEKPNPADYVTGLSARNGQLLIVDESTLEVTKIKSPFSRCKFIIMDSRVPRLGVDTELEARKEALKNGLEMLSQGREGANFREFAAMDLMDSMGDFPEEIRRRSLHVVQEIRRVLDAGDCLSRADIPGFSRLVFSSHESLRDLYEVSCPEIDWMVKRAQETDGVLGARMTGQGFGGCTYTIIKNEAVNGYRERLEDYERIFGFRPGIHEMKIATGSRVVDS